MPEEEKKGEKVVLHVDMHCEGCKAKVRKALKQFKGVEGLEVSLQEQKVTIRGKLDAMQVYETVKKKSGKRTFLIYPDLSKIAQQGKKPAEQEPKKEQPPPPDPEIVVVLKVSMHCAACAKQIRKSLLKMDGVHDVKEDFLNSTVTVKGKKIDASKLCGHVKKRSGKHCEIVLSPHDPPPPPPAAEPKEEEKKEAAKPAEEKKEEEAKPAEEAKKEEEKPADEKKEEEKPADEKKEEGKDDKKESVEERKEEETKEKKELEKIAKEKKEEKKEVEKKKEEGAEETKTEVKKYEYIPCRSVSEYYVYPPQIFSDENPNACSIM